MLMSCLFSPEFEIGEGQNGMLVLSPRYTSPITSSGAQHIYSKLIEVIVYYPRLLKKQGSMCIHKRLKGEE